MKLTKAQRLLKKFPDLLKSKPNENCLVDLACPKCGQRDRFRIECFYTMPFVDEGSDDQGGDSEFTGRYCECAADRNVCEETGTLRKFTFPGLDGLIEQAQAGDKTAATEAALEAQHDR